MLWNLIEQPHRCDIGLLKNVVIGPPCTRVGGVKFSTSEGTVMPCGWEGNRRSGVALAMRHRFQWFIHLRAHGPRKGDEHPTCTPHGAWHTSLFLYLYLNDSWRTCCCYIGLGISSRKVPAIPDMNTKLESPTGKRHDVYCTRSWSFLRLRDYDYFLCRFLSLSLYRVGQMFHKAVWQQMQGVLG